MSDRRNARTEAALRGALVTMLEHGSLEKITVSSLARIADVGRGTFYLHYASVYDLYDSVVQNVSVQMRVILDETYPHGKESARSYSALSMALVRYVRAHRTELKAIFRDRHGERPLDRLRTELVDGILAREGAGAGTVEDVVESRFAVHGMMGVLVDWLSGRLSVDEERLAAILDALIARV